MSDRQPSVTFGGDLTPRLGDNSTADIRRTIGQDLTPAISEENVAPASRGTTRTDTAESDSMTGQRTPVVKTWKEGNQLVVERDGIVVEVRREA